MAGAILEATGWGDPIDDYLLALGFRVAPPVELMAVANTLELEGTGPCWNDQRERTLDQVLDRLESTALALEVRALAADSAAKPDANVIVRSPELVGV
jgi:hypothetical protein